MKMVVGQGENLDKYVVRYKFIDFQSKVTKWIKRLSLV